MKAIIGTFILIFSVSSSAQFVSETARVDTPEYVRFFHERFQTWYAKNVFDFSTVGPEEEKLVRVAVKKLDRFGIRRNETFVRGFGYEALATKQETGPYAFSFINFGNDPDISAALKRIASKHGVNVDKWNVGSHLGGTIFSVKNQFALKIFVDEIQKATAIVELRSHVGDKKGSGVITILFIDKKIAAVSLLESNVKTDKICSVAVDYGQIDRVSSDKGEVFYWHVRRAEPKAVPGPAQKILANVRDGMNLQPGLLSCQANGNLIVVYP